MSDSEALGRILDALAREDAHRVLDEARELAVRRVRDHVAEELERRLLERLAQARPEPGSPAEHRPLPRDDEPAPQTAPASASKDPGRGVYVYAVVDRDAAPDLPRELRGVAGTTVRAIAEGRLRAIVSDVPLDQFDDDALRRNLNDLTWLSDTAVAHEAVVDAALGMATVVPMRLCTIFRTDAAVRDMLARERGALEETLDRLRGASEWGVKVIADRRAFADAVGRRDDRVRALQETIEEAGEGAGYLAGRQLERLTQEVVDAELDDHTRAIHQALSAVAEDERVNPPSNRELAGYTGDMVLNAAYLVTDERRDEFRAVAASLAAEHREWGLAVELTGPWPPYNFSTMAGAL